MKVRRGMKSCHKCDNEKSRKWYESPCVSCIERSGLRRNHTKIKIEIYELPEDV